MRWVLAAAFWCLVAVLAAGQAVAAARLQAMRIDGIGILTVGNVGRAPVIVAAGRGQLVIETHVRLPADAANRLNVLRAMVTGVTVAGSRLRLALAPGVTSTSQPLEGGELSISLEQAGPAADPPPSPPPAPKAVAAPARTVPVPAPRPVLQAGKGLAPGTGQPTLAAAVQAPEAPMTAAIPDHGEVTGLQALGGVELSFAWPMPVRAAVFQRAGVLWATFDAAPGVAVGVAGLRDRSLAAWLEPLAPMTVDHAQLFRFQLRRKLRVEAVQDGATWRVRLTPEGSNSPVEAPVGVRRDTGLGVLQGPAPVRALDLEDPETGERLGALLAAGGRLRQPAAVRLVDLELLPAAQGLAWQPLADGVTVAAGEGGFTLTREGGLRLSGGNDDTPAPPHAPAAEQLARRPVAAASPSPLTGPPALLGLPTLAGTDPVGRQKARLELAGRLAGMESLPRAAARLDQARLLLADGLGPEARTTLDRLLPDDLPPAAARSVERSRAALAGAAAALEGQPDKALGRLRGPALDDDQEVALWRAYAAARAGRHQFAGQEWQRGSAVLAAYPMPLRLTLGLEIAASLAQHGDARQARDLLALLHPVAAEAAAEARLQLLRGIAATRTEQPEVAEQALASAIDGGDADTAVRADFLLAITRHEQGALDAAGAAAVLATQRPGWRGHPWEARMLRQLGTLQMQAGEPLAAFATTLEAAGRPGEAAAAATEDLRGRLKEVIRAAAAGKASPITALTLHRAHGELLDGDSEAPALRRELAGLAPAAGLDQSSHTLLEQVGAKLPAGATALQPEEAAASRQRLDAATRAGDWAEAAREAEALLARHPGDGPLPEEGAAALVSLALARTHMDAPEAAAQLASRYEARLPEGSWRSLLALIAVSAPEQATEADAATAGSTLASSVRQHLDELEPLGAAPRNAAVRSNPGG